MALDKTFNPTEFEKDIAKKWRKKRFFSLHDETKKPFTILLPPPNVTGKLHIGHALNVYIQDTIIRYKKLSNYDVFFVAGSDHAGIATQSKVENHLVNTIGKNRHDLGREEFIKKVWEWKEEYGSLIHNQWDALGLGLDYERERFTLDEKSNQAVNKAFVDFYNRGLIYKGTKAINYDPILKTAISNIEVINKPTEQDMLYIKYPYADEPTKYLTIATVRPETMLSDVAIIYNPNDKRYKHLDGLKIKHPLLGTIIPLIADEYANIDFGSGLMKVSAHAEADVEIIKKHNLELRETIDTDGLINCPNSQFHRMERFEARKAITKFLSDNNFVVKITKTTSNVGYSERSNAPVETLVMPQWFVKMDELAKLILDDLASIESVKFYPKRFKNTLKTWMENVHDWTISRQLWWGHRIPAWYKDSEMKVQESCPGEGWKQDEDVLDTWFSSGLAPFSFLGWPLEENKKMLQRYFPTSTLVTGYDIIFFWVARMYFFSKAFMKSKPFNDVILTGLVRDSQGRKMSKSLNNGIDPIDLINKYGSDALRWFLITNTSHGLDIRFNEQKIEAAWGLGNKLWNIARFIESLPNDNNSKLSIYDKWINNQLNKLQLKISKAFNRYEFTIMGRELMQFIYTDFSSWYVEFLKLSPNKEQALLMFKKLLQIMHPFMPFVTDYLHQKIYSTEVLDTIFEEVKISRAKSIDDVNSLIKIIQILRKHREERQISKKEVIYYSTNYNLNSLMVEVIKKLANAELKNNEDVLYISDKISVFVAQSEEEKEKLVQEIKDHLTYLESEINRAQNMLNNPSFVAKAPVAKVNLEQEKLKKLLAEYEQYKEKIK
ncbi:valine--tRNA ligase [Mycoplasmopsis opalescens]|uniref:valine--tRNA ligase n=1 Tax=Mycoplasmopsis opalescens TaxID=114886 RepID=UPI0004A73504|nr:valine--tRNA ligase [Mycoplasmopsis opalescens]